MIPKSKNIYEGTVNREKFDIILNLLEKTNNYLYLNYPNISLYSPLFAKYRHLFSEGLTVFLESNLAMCKPRILSILIQKHGWRIVKEYDDNIIDIDGIINIDNIEDEQIQFQFMINYGIDLNKIEFMDKNDFVDKIMDIIIKQAQ